MIGRVLDSVVGAFSPERGVRRSMARQVLRAYDGAKQDRTKGRPPTNQPADAELFSDADKIRARARDLVRNDAYAAGVVNAICRNVVGCGMYPEPRTEKDKFNETIDKLWDRWQERADIAGGLSFYEMQNLALREMVEAGECLIHFVRSNDHSRVLPFALEMIEADRIAGDAVFTRGVNPDTGNEVRRGVELDHFGAPVAYHVYERNPLDFQNYNSMKPRRLPAAECLHLFKRRRIGQTRGISDFAPVIVSMMDLKRYKDSEQKAQAAAACLAVLIKSFGGAADGSLLPSTGGESTDANGNNFERLESQMVARLMPGEDVSIVNPSRGQGQAVVWVTHWLRSLGVGTGLSYERLTRDYSQTNYSSNRASDLEDRREFRPLQDYIIRALCRPVWVRFLAAAIAEGGKNLPTVERFVAHYDDYLEHAWQVPGWEWVDPVKEVTADVMGIEKGLNTYADALGRQGKYWKDVFKQRKAEQDYAEEIGLQLSAQNVIPIAAAALAAETAEIKAAENATTTEKDDAEEPAGELAAV